MKYDVFDFIEFADVYGISYTVGGKNSSTGWIQTKCPFCDDPSEHLGFETTKGYFTCWRCGWHPVYKTITALCGKQIAPVKLNTYYETKEPGSFKKAEDIDIGKLVWPTTYDKRITCTPRHIAAIHKRGFETHVVNKIYDLRYVANIYDPHHRYMAWRVLFPVYTSDHVPVSYIGYNVGSLGLKYQPCKKEYEAAPHKHYLFGEQLTDSVSIIITEGIFDAVRMGVGAVAMLGVQYTKHQLVKISRYQYVYLMLDNDDAGKTATINLIDELSSFDCEVYTIKYKGKDPDSLKHNDITAIRKEIF